MVRWLGLFSLLLAAVLGWAFWDNTHREWKPYQRAYSELVLGQAQTEAQRQWAIEQRLEIKQYDLQGLGRVDRCPTCHLGIDNPALKQAPEPFRTHTLFLDSHPPQRFGCTSCHKGEGRATTTLAAHGEESDSLKHLLKGEYMQVACYSCHGENTLFSRDTSAIRQGRQLVNRYLCLRCHQVEGEGGSEGPDLSSIGSRRNWVWTYAHLVNPQAMTIGSTMPRFPLSREELKNITTFLLTLEGGQERTKDPRLMARKKAQKYVPWPQERGAEDMALSGAVPSVDYKGRELFFGLGCGYCHAIGQKGGEVGPTLTYVGQRRDKEWLQKMLKDPEQTWPGGQMPQMYLTPEQIKVLVEYLSSLK